MKFSSSENVRWYALVIGLAAALILLAALQYQSSKQVSDATTEQMRNSLQGSLMDLRLGLERELAPLCRELQVDSGVPRRGALKEYVSHFDRWRRAAAHPGLVSDVFVWRAGGMGKPELMRLNSDHTEFQVADWPANFEPLRQRLQETASQFGAPAGYSDPRQLPDAMLSGRPPRRSSPPREMAPDSGDGTSDAVGENVPRHEQPGAIPRRSSPAPRGSAHPPLPVSSTSFPWMIDQNIPALVHPVLEINERVVPYERASATVTWIVVSLNVGMLGHHILPELAQRYFGRSDQLSYELAVIGENAHRSVIYSSDPGFGGQNGAVPDAALNLFGRPLPIVGGEHSASQRVFAPRSPPAQERLGGQGGPAGPPPEGRDEFHGEGPVKIDPIDYTPDERDWEIIARHRKGSVEAAVAVLYHRSLAINFGVLLVLATTIGMIIAASQRARRLAQLQMDFVASVSHELRTPLTGIVSAAQNIADGVVSSKERMARYGAAILGQAQQLTELVEQILLFSATQKERHRYHFQLVDVAEVLEASLKSTSSLIRSSGFTVDKDIQTDLPEVMVDLRALSQCLQNLIANAVKYGGVSRWIGIRAVTADGLDGGREVRITVADKGMGIEREDLKRIFEPFYRTPAATAAQIHGSGLGLPLAQTIAEAMGGRLTVESVPKEGSAFTVHLPAKDEPRVGDQLSVTSEAKSIS